MTQPPAEDQWVEGEIKFTLHGEPIEMKMTVPANPVKPTRVLPVFQQMTNSFVEIGEKAVEEEGERISCKKGCGACCRQPVPLAEIEAYQIAELVENMPEPRRSEIKKRFADGAKHFHDNQWFEKMDNYANLSLDERRETVMGYFYEGIPCPFLEEESCSIHLDRPLGCREYLVTSPAENCKTPSAETIKLIKIPLKPSETLRYIGHSVRMTQGINFVPMIRALEWAETYPENMPEKPGPEWVSDFFTLLTKKEIPKNDPNGVN